MSEIPYTMRKKLTNYIYLDPQTLNFDVFGFVVLCCGHSGL